MKLNDIIRAKVLALVLTIAALAVGQTVLAMSTFTVSSPNSDNTFRITRTGNTAVAETIDWRVVSLSAIAGVHFTGYQGNYSGQVTFAPGDPYKDVTISEDTPGNNAYKYQNGTTRSYRFEVLDRDGSILASKDRTMTTGTSVPSSGLFNEKEITIYTSEVQYSDAGYDQSNNPHYIESSAYYNLTGIAPKAYYTLIGAQLRTTLSLDAKEKNNGYQYVQILINNTSTCDNRSKCDDGDPGNINLSRYMAGFDHEPSKANTNYATYTFPVTSQPNNCSEVSNAWSNGVTNKLYTQKFNTNCRATDGRLILPVDFEKFVVRFNASGGGSDHDEWLAKNVKAHIQAVDGTAPTVQNNYKVSGGRHQKGNTIYVSVAFSEIVVVTGTPTLSSNWGTLSYVAGSGSNVLTFKGTIDPSDNNAFGVSGYTLNGGTIKDLAGNSFSGSISHSFGTTLDEDYAWTTSDFNQLETNTYEIYTTLDMRHLALMVNSGNNNCSGLTFKQTHDITYTHTTNWNNSSSQEDNYTAIGTDDHGFQGTFDGQDHTISGIRIYRGDYTSADDYQGLFGYISGGTVRGVNLADARITGFKYVGGIAGKIYSCTVKDCTVAADVCIHAVHGDSDYHGGIVGNSQGTVQRCLSRARLTVTDASDCGYYGAIVGYNNNHAVKDCIAIGASVPSVSNAGAIIGYGNINGAYDVQRNYYRDCTVAGVENATGVGVGYDKNTKSHHDVTANQGAQALYSLTLSSGVTQVRTASATLPGTGNKTYTTGADIDGTPYAFDGAALTFSYTGEAVTTMGYAVLFYKDGTPFEGNSYKMTKSDVSITASATDLWGIADNADGSADHPYHIGTRTALDLLASYVNNGVSEFDSKHFLQTENLTYDVITTYINNVPTVTSNYTAIGYYNDDNDHKAFKGHYNGGGRTITGIQIVKTGHGNSDGYLGLFGYVDGGTIENVVLTQSQIKGNRNIGSIAGYLQNGTIQNCYIGSNVSIVIGNASNAAYQGGVVGQMSSGSCVQGCFCGANINRSDQISTANWYYGGIAGYSLGTIQNNIYTGSFYNYKLDSFGGAIAGDHSGGTLANNYYTSKDVPGGINYTDQDGARQARTVSLGENIALVGDETAYSASGLTAFGTTALQSGETIYSGEGQTLTLSYSGDVPMGYKVTYSVNDSPIAGNSFTMPAGNANVTAAVVPDAATYWGADADHDGTTAERAYIITTTAGLDLLAAEVNSGNHYSDTYFKLGDDLTYSYAGLGATESNYTAIGGYYNGFKGIFDGDGFTVSGIRIYKGGTTNEDNYQGLFGMVNDGTIRNVTLSDAVITGKQYVGGIAGYITASSKGSTIENCHVTSSVTIHAVADYAYEHGGIVGRVNGGSVSNCTSAATLSMADGLTACRSYGGIVGDLNGTVQNCLVSGATISGTDFVGAIVGYKSSDTLTNNYYSGCTVNGTATGVGCGREPGNTSPHDITTNDGAVCVFTLTLADGVTATPTPTFTYSSTRYYKAGTEVSLSYSALEGYTFNGNYIVKDAQDNDVSLSGNTFEMPASNVTAKADLTAIPWTGSGSEDDPYLIQYPSQLDLLATRVNAGGGSDYYQKFIKLGADIAYDGTENNYTPIGNNSGAYSFQGIFDGDGHTVSGININRGNDYQGLFGYVDGGTVKNVTLANSTITANNRVGGIAGYNHGTVQNCRVESTVTINAYADDASNYGGIVGYCDYGTVDGCISSATISHNDKNHCYPFAAIAGNNNRGTIRNCLAIGATVSSSSNRGAIVGLNNGGTLTSNYYYNCTVGGSTTNVGTRDGDVTENDGAVAATILSESETVPSSLSDKVAFRREFKGGKASTVIFPFAHEKGTEGTYYTFGGVAYDGLEGKWKATMNEYTSATLAANTPYLFVPAGSEAHAPVLFHGTADYHAAGTTDVTDWSFVGVYETKVWTAGDVGNDYGFAATSGKATDGVTDVQAGDFVKLAEGAWIRPMRSYLTYTGGGNPWQTANAPAHRAAAGDMPDRISVLLVSSNGETTRIENGELRIENSGAWYTLNGVKLQGKPSAKGIYIHRGKKVAIR